MPPVQSITIRADAIKAISPLRPLVEGAVDVANAAATLLAMIPPGDANPLLIDRRHVAELQAALERFASHAGAEGAYLEGGR